MSKLRPKKGPLILISNIEKFMVMIVHYNTYQHWRLTGLFVLVYGMKFFLQWPPILFLELLKRFTIRSASKKLREPPWYRKRNTKMVNEIKYIHEIYSNIHRQFSDLFKNKIYIYKYITMWNLWGYEWNNIQSPHIKQKNKNPNSCEFEQVNNLI